MKKYLFISLCFVFLVTCKRETNVFKDLAKDNDKEVVDKAKLWYDSVKTSMTESKVVQANSNLSMAKLNAGGDPGIPNWGKAKVERRSNNITLTYLPYEQSSTPLHLTKYGFRRMLIFTYEYGDKQAFWVEVNAESPLPSGEFSLANFTGKVLVFDLNNNFLTGNKYIDGVQQTEIHLGTKEEISEQLRVAALQGNGKSTSSSGNSDIQVEGGGLICYDYYVRGCVPATGWCSEWVYNNTSCEYVDFGPGSTAGGTGSGGTGGGGTGGGSTGGGTGTGDHEPGSGGAGGIGVNEIGYTFPDNLFGGKDGNKPLGDYATICAGVQALWDASVHVQKETVGLITQDGKFIYIAQVDYSGGSFGGLAVYQGQAYYSYPDSQGYPAYNYAGIIHSAHQYWIPIKGTVHTHSPCLDDGTDGISNTTLSEADQQLSKTFKMIPNYIIGCGAVGQYNNGSTSPWVLQTGNLNDTCSSIK